IDIEELEFRTHLELSNPRELLLRLRWLGILSSQLDCSLACSGGVHDVTDAIKAIMSGAHAVQLVAALLRGGPPKLATLQQDLVRWLDEHEYDSLAQMRGSMNSSRTPDPTVFERGNYMRMLRTWRFDGAAPWRP
ncbi:MAG: dihydroorotate dehydrogenase-like protein, partial [Planctomycetes bacterium]|nr:dihydroorotate dehydrogenase-like protein [Planctomycetota bacterium]